MAAGLLAFSGVGAPAAVASGADEEIEGATEMVEVGEPASVEVGEPASVELGEVTAPLADAEALVPDDEEGPETPGEEVAAAAVPEAESGEAVVETSGEAVAPPPEPSPSPEPVAVVAPPVAVVPPAPEEVVPGSGAVVGPRVDRESRTKRVVRHSPKPAPAAAQPVTTAPPRAPVTTAAPVMTPRAPVTTPAPVTTTPRRAPVTTHAPVTAPATVRVVAGTRTSGEQASPEDRFHVVQRGESLWSIAAAVLGDDATVARVAREVNRLWSLNEDRIASGDPDLLFAGTRLRLR